MIRKPLFNDLINTTVYETTVICFMVKMAESDYESGIKNVIKMPIQLTPDILKEIQK